MNRRLPTIGKLLMEPYEFIMGQDRLFGSTVVGAYIDPLLWRRTHLIIFLMKRS